MTARDASRRKIGCSPATISTDGAERGIRISYLARPVLRTESRSTSDVKEATPSTARTRTSSPSVSETVATPLSRSPVNRIVSRSPGATAMPAPDGAPPPVGALGTAGV